MSATYMRIAAPLILSLVTACASKITQPTTTARAALAPPSMVYVTGSRLGISSSSGRTQGAQPLQSVGQQQIKQSGQASVSDSLHFLVPATSTSAVGMMGGK